MAKFCAQTMPYRDLGSGIPRVLADKSKVDTGKSYNGSKRYAICYAGEQMMTVGYVAGETPTSLGCGEWYNR